MKLFSKVKTAVMAGVLAVAGAGAIATSTYAGNCTCVNNVASGDCSEAEKGMCQASGGGTPASLDTTVKNIINGVLYVVGILAVVMVIIGGVKYTTSGGDSAAVTSAKNTILYGIIGLVIAILAYAIVNFVIGKL